MLTAIRNCIDQFREWTDPRRRVKGYKIAVLVVLTGDDEYQRVFESCLRSIVDYCEHRGYEYLRYDRNYYPDRQAAWSRIGYLKELFQERTDITHVLYLDADVMVTNPNFAVERLVEVLERRSKQILFTIDAENNLNDGVAVYKNSRDTIKILEVVEGYREYNSHPWWENAAFMRAVLDDHFCNAGILKMANTRIMNSYIKGRCRWQFGDFIIHFAGIPQQDRKVLIPAFYDFITRVKPYLPEVDPLDDHLGIGS